MSESMTWCDVCRAPYRWVGEPQEMNGLRGGTVEPTCACHALLTAVNSMVDAAWQELIDGLGAKRDLKLPDMRVLQRWILRR